MVQKTSRKEEFIKYPNISLWKLALPMMLGMSVNAIYMMIDMFFIAKYEPNIGVASIGYVTPFLFMLMGITFGLGSGVTSVIAKSIGEDNKNDADKAAEHSIVFGILISLILFLSSILFGESLLKFQGVNDLKILTHSLDYFYIMFGGSIFMILGVFFRSILSGEGDNVFPVKVLGVGTVINILLDPIFIDLYSVKGAALATVISQAIVCLIFIYYLIFKHNAYIKFNFRKFSYNQNIINNILKIGFPASLSMIIMSVGIFLFNIILTLGSGNEIAVAAYQIGGRIEHLFFIPIISIATALVTLVAMYYGANRFDLIIHIVKYGLTKSLLISLCFSSFFYFFIEDIIHLFSTSQIELEYTISYFMVPIFAYPFITIGMTCSRIMQGLGHGIPMLVLTILRVVVINSCFAWYFVINLNKPIEYAWYSILISCIITSILSISWMFRIINLNK